MRIIRHLFNHDFNISAQNYAGWTALHKAVHTNHLDAVEVLLREGRIDYKLTTVKKVSTSISETKTVTLLLTAEFLLREGLINYKLATVVKKSEISFFKTTIAAQLFDSCYKLQAFLKLT